MRNSWYPILVTVAVLTTSCDKQTQTKSERQSVSMSATSSQVEENSTSISESAPQTTNQAKTFELALDKAAGAYSISQSAQSTDDWRLVVGKYQDAVALMKQVQRDDPYYSIAQQKISEYQQRVKQAQLRTIASAPKLIPEPQPTQVIVVPETQIKPKIQANAKIVTAPKPTKIIAPVFSREPQQPPLEVEPQIQPIIPPEVFINQQTEEQVITVPIKRRMGGTPVIEVKFNGNQNFEMIVDTGASGTVITQKMADSLSIVPVGHAKANTASSKAVTFPIGYINSMEVGEVKINQIPVAIAGAGLETGLLGHDFFGNYDITIKRDVVQFRPHTPTDTTKTAETQPGIPIYPKLRR